MGQIPAKLTLESGRTDIPRSNRIATAVAAAALLLCSGAARAASSCPLTANSLRAPQAQWNGWGAAPDNGRFQSEKNAGVPAWVVSLGRRDAYQRVAHLLCELHYRALTVGLVKDDRFDLPLTQNEIADAAGLTSVHVNRTIQRLRADGLIELSGRVLTIKDVSGLQQAGGFDPAYLHIQKR